MVSHIDEVKESDMSDMIDKWLMKGRILNIYFFKRTYTSFFVFIVPVIHFQSELNKSYCTKLLQIAICDFYTA